MIARRVGPTLTLLVGLGIAVAVRAEAAERNIHGAPAVAIVSIEPLPNFTLVAGEVRSGAAVYSFKADIVGTSGFGEMLDFATNQRFQIRIDATANGFALTSNPLGPGQPSTYFFSRQ